MPSQIGNDKRAIGMCQTRCKGTRRNLVAKLALSGIVRLVMKKSNLIHFSAQAKRAAKNAKRRKAAVARRRAKAKEIRDAAEKR